MSLSRDSYELQFTESINRTMHIPDKVTAKSSINNSALNDISKKPKDKINGLDTEAFDHIEGETDYDDGELELELQKARLSPGFSPILINKPIIPDRKLRRISKVAPEDIEFRLRKLENEVNLLKQIGICTGGILAVYYAVKILGFVFLRR